MKPSLRFLLATMFCASSLMACGDDASDDQNIEDKENGNNGGGVESDIRELGYTEADLNTLGPYTVGFRRTNVVYTPPGENEERSLITYIWYPAKDNTEGLSRSVLKLANLVSIPGLIAWRDAQPADLGKLPVVFYSHGSGGDGVLGYPYAEHFASRGWAFISVSHTGNTLLSDNNNDTILRTAFYRPLDVSETLDNAVAGFGDEALKGLFDVDRTFMFGHSFGGFTSLVIGGASLEIEQAKAKACDNPESRACLFYQDPAVVARIEQGLSDPRVKAIGLQAASMMEVLDPKNIEIPTLMLSGVRDLTTTEDNATFPIWAGLTHPQDLWLHFTDMGHFSFITICDVFGASVVSTFVRDSEEDGCGEDFVPPLTVAEINKAYLTAFAERYVLGVEDWDKVLQSTEPLKVVGDAELEIHTHLVP